MANQNKPNTTCGVITPVYKTDDAFMRFNDYKSFCGALNLPANSAASLREYQTLRAQR